MKQCSACHELKPANEFYAKMAQCKPCRVKVSQKWKAANPEKAQAYSRAAYLRSSDTEQHAKRLWSVYRIRPEDYEAMLLEQGGTCATCPTTPETQGSRLRVDHDHACCSGSRSCGKCLRGLLCHNCNVALGHVQDDSERLMKLARYVNDAHTRKGVISGR